MSRIASNAVSISLALHLELAGDEADDQLAIVQRLSQIDPSVIIDGVDESAVVLVEVAVEALRHMPEGKQREDRCGGDLEVRFGGKHFGKFLCQATWLRIRVRRPSRP